MEKARKHRPEARWMLRLLTLLALHCCRKGAVAQLTSDETFVFESTALLEPLSATIDPSMAAITTSSSFQGRASSAIASTQPQPSLSVVPTVSVPQAESSSSILQSSEQITLSIGTISSFRTSTGFVPSLSPLPIISSQLLPRTSVLLLQSTQRPMPTSSTDTSLVASSMTTSEQPSTSVASRIGAEETSALSLVSTSPVPEPEPTSSVPEPNTSMESQAEPTSSLVRPSPSAMLTTVVTEASSSSSSMLTTSTIGGPGGVLPSSSISETTSTSTPGEVLPTSSTVLPSASSSESVVGQTESAASITGISSPRATTVAVLPSRSLEEASTILPVPSTQTQPPVAATSSTPPTILPVTSTRTQPPVVTTTSPSPTILPVPSTRTQPPVAATTSTPPTPESTDSPMPSALPSPSGGATGTTGPPTTPSTETTDTPVTDDPTSQPPTGPTSASFFTLPVIVGISAGGVVIAILLLIILILCCCCICSHASKSRQYSLEDSAENPTSIFANGRYPQNRRESNESVQAYELNYVQVQNPTYDDNEDQLHEPISQVSGDIFRETSLPGLSPLSYNSQLQRLYQISVDHPDEGSLSAANIRSSLLGKFPHSSPSLAVPTRMGLSLEKEETKSSHGSRTSIPGSSKPPSYHGSKASIIGSKHSIQSSRSSFLNSSHSRDDMKPLFVGRQNSSSPEDDFLGAQFSGRTGSPILKEDIIESPTDDSLVPTRDSPVMPPLATSHALKHGKKDFASLTCIPNHQALADEFGYDFPLAESTPKIAESYAAESILPSSRKKSSSKINLGALTTLEQESRSEMAEKPTDATDSERPRTVSEPAPIISGDSKANALSPVKDSPKSSPAPKKQKSRAMSKLEKLTSLDHIRASLRLKKKKVSFEKTPKTKSPTPKLKKKKPTAKPEPVMFANKAAAAALSANPTEENGLETPTNQSPVDYQEPKRPPDIPTAPHPKDENVFVSPDIYPEDFAGGFQRHYAGRPRAYSDMHGMSYPQLSQPTYFPGHMGGGQFQSAYPQLSQPYYQLSQGAYYPPHVPYPQTHAPLPLPSHSLPPQPSHLHQTSDGSGREPYSPRYAATAMPGAGRYPDVVTPDAYLPPNQDRFRDISSPDRFTDSSSFMDRYHDGARSPDTCTETSNTSERYQATSPDGYMGTSNRYRDVRSPDRWTDSSYPNYDEPISPTGFGYPTPGRFLGDRHRADHLLEMESKRQRRNSGDRLLEPFNSSRRHSSEMHNRYPDSMDSGRRNSLQKEESDPGYRHGADHRRQHSPDSMERERRQPLDRYSDSFSEQEDIRSPEHFSAFSDVSTSGKFSDASVTKSRVSWSTEVIEYPRTPSPDLEYGSDFDAL